MSERYPLVGLDVGMVLVIGRFYARDMVRDIVMALDTGSSLTVLTPQAIRELGMDPEHPVGHRQTFAWGGSRRVPILVVPRVRVFGQEVHDLEVACGELPPRLGISGVLGLNFLRHFDLRINFREEYIELR